MACDCDPTSNIAEVRLWNTESHAVHEEGELQMHQPIVIAHCPYCHSELPVGLEQAVWLRDGGRLWLFCPLCIRVVCADRVVSTRNSAESSGSSSYTR